MARRYVISLLYVSKRYILRRTLISLVARAFGAGDRHQSKQPVILCFLGDLLGNLLILSPLLFSSLIEFLRNSYDSSVFVSSYHKNLIKVTS